MHGLPEGTSERLKALGSVKAKTGKRENQHGIEVEAPVYERWVAPPEALINTEILESLWRIEGLLEKAK